MRLFGAPTLSGAGTWIVLGISAWFIVACSVMHHILMKVLGKMAQAPRHRFVTKALHDHSVFC